MRYEVPARNWVSALAEYIERAQDGDVIVVTSSEAKELAERMCPDKKITFEVRVIEGAR